MISQEISRNPLRSNKRHLAWLLATFVQLSVAGPAAAQEGGETHPILTSTYSINVGIFFPERSFEIGVDGSIPGIQRDVDISEAFKIGSSETTQSYEFGWRFSEKWLTRGQYFKVGGAQSAVLEEDVQWGDFTFRTGTGIAGGIDVAITRLFLGRTFSATENQEFGIGGGLHRLAIDAFVAGQAIVNDQPPAFTERRASTRGPVPNLGAWYVYAFNSRWAVHTRLDWLSASIDKYDGTIINAAAGVNFAFNEHFLVGASYQYFEIDLEVTDDPWRGFVENKVDGAFAYLSFHW